jgi:hypothetical protein
MVEGVVEKWRVMVESLVDAEGTDVVTRRTGDLASREEPGNMSQRR